MLEKLVYIERRVRRELEKHMENHKTSIPLLSSFWDQVFKTRRQMNGHHEQIHQGKKKTTTKRRRGREERRLKIILCAPTQKQLERRIPVNLHAVSTVAFRRRAWTHTGEAFGCSFCCCSSPDKQLLRKHIKRYHLGSGTSLTSSQPPFTLRSLLVEH